MKIEFASKVEKGIAPTNDDRILVDGKIIDQSSSFGVVDIPTLVAVCDGCGGYAGGGIAAHTVLEILSSEEVTNLLDINYLTKTLEKCQKKIMTLKQETEQYSAMCTTIAGCLFSCNSNIIFHSGDSRVYRLDKFGLARMTNDHSIVQELINSGEISLNEAKNHPQRNVITNCIGVNVFSPEIYVSHSPIWPGEKYLFCSDGLWDSLEDSRITEILSSNISIQEMTDIMVNEAIRNGSDDNISVCICSYNVNKEVTK